MGRAPDRSAAHRRVRDRRPERQRGLRGRHLRTAGLGRRPVARETPLRAGNPGRSPVIHCPAGVQPAHTGARPRTRTYGGDRHDAEHQRTGRRDGRRRGQADRADGPGRQICTAPTAPAPPPCTRCAGSPSRCRAANSSPSRAARAPARPPCSTSSAGSTSPTRAPITVDGTDVVSLGEQGLLELRRDRIGFIFQSFGLIPILSAAENVGVPMRLKKADPREREERVALLLSLVGLGDHAAAAARRALRRPAAARRHRPRARQPARPAHRGRAHRPARRRDRPRGDGAAARRRRSEGVTALVATHDSQLLGLADRVLELGDGQLVDHGPRLNRVDPEGGASESRQYVAPAPPPPHLPELLAVRSTQRTQLNSERQWGHGTRQASDLPRRGTGRRQDVRDALRGPPPGGARHRLRRRPSSSTTAGRAPR